MAARKKKKRALRPANSSAADLIQEEITRKSSFAALAGKTVKTKKSAGGVVSEIARQRSAVKLINSQKAGAKLSSAQKQEISDAQARAKSRNKKKKK